MDQRTVQLVAVLKATCVMRSQVLALYRALLRVASMESNAATKLENAFCLVQIRLDARLGICATFYLVSALLLAPMIAVQWINSAATILANASFLVIPAKTVLKAIFATSSQDCVSLLAPFQAAWTARAAIIKLGNVTCHVATTKTVRKVCSVIFWLGNALCPALICRA
jgi:putative effector of murein hydrolase LrgA (UPF0299 family)